MGSLPGFLVLSETCAASTIGLRASTSDESITKPAARSRNASTRLSVADRAWHSHFANRFGIMFLLRSLNFSPCACCQRAQGIFLRLRDHTELLAGRIF